MLRVLCPIVFNLNFLDFCIFHFCVFVGSFTEKPAKSTQQWTWRRTWLAGTNSRLLDWHRTKTVLKSKADGTRQRKGRDDRHRHSIDGRMPSFLTPSAAVSRADTSSACVSCPEVSNVRSKGAVWLCRAAVGRQETECWGVVVVIAKLWPIREIGQSPTWAPHKFRLLEVLYWPSTRSDQGREYYVERLVRCVLLCILHKPARSSKNTNVAIILAYNHSSPWQVNNRNHTQEITVKRTRQNTNFIIHPQTRL